MQRVPFDYLQHLVTLAVSAGGLDTRFVFDSGIGLSLVSEPLAQQLACEPTGSTFSGRRMSGQEVGVPLATLDSLAVGDYRRHALTVGVFDMSAFPGFDGIEGFLSLDHFRETTVTVDYASKEITVGARASGASVSVCVEQDGPSTAVFMPLELPHGRTVSVEVDMGSDALILDERFAGELRIDLGGAAVRTVHGRDETGQDYARHFTTLRGVVRVPTAPSLAQRDPDVMFQRIIYDGLVGHSFLRNFAVTYDLPNERLLFAQ
jgi:Aspartyl protease